MKSSGDDKDRKHRNITIKRAREAEYADMEKARPTTWSAMHKPYSSEPLPGVYRAKGRV